jgi:hypothetical protein
MTRDRMVELLGYLVLELDKVEPPEAAPSVEQALRGDRAIAREEWRYITGLASGAVLRLRDQLRGVSS